MVGGSLLSSPSCYQVLIHVRYAPLMTPARKTARTTRAKKAQPAAKAPLARKRSREHGQAIAQASEIRRYLVATRQTGLTSPQRASAQLASIERRLKKIDAGFDQANPLTQLRMCQERLDLLARAKQLSASPGHDDHTEAAFVKSASAYGARHGISYAAWRAMGVPAGVLKRAKISRTTSPPSASR